MTRRRQLSDEERAAWTGFARSITPLRRGEKTAGSAAARVPVPVRQGDAERPVAAPAKAPPLAPLGRRLRQRVARGREPIDAGIDLHGMTQDHAHAALLRFLRRCQSDGCRIVLVVTGKGTGRGERDASAERGVLRRQVPMWLSLPEFRSLIVGFEDAYVSHGGHGALYVRLRRRL